MRIVIFRQLIDNALDLLDAEILSAAVQVEMRMNSWLSAVLLLSFAWVPTLLANAEIGSRPIISTTARSSDSNLFRGDRVCD